MTLQDFIRDVSNALRPKPQVPPPAYAYARPVPVVQVPRPMVAPIQPNVPGGQASLVSSSAHGTPLTKSDLVGGK